MKYLSGILLITAFLLCSTAVFAEYGLVPVDNQVERQFFNESIMYQGPYPKCPYDSVSIQGNTLILNVTPFGKAGYEAGGVENMKRLDKIRINQMLQMAGSPTKISNVVCYFNGKLLKERRLTKEELLEVEKKNNEIEREKKKTEKNHKSQLNRQQKQINSYKLEIEKAISEEVCSFEEQTENNSSTDYRTVTCGRVFYDSIGNKIAEEKFKLDDNGIPNWWTEDIRDPDTLEYNRVKWLIKREGTIPDGIADLSGSDGRNCLSTPYKNNKRNGIEKEYSNGMLIREIPFKDDTVDGTVKIYYDELYSYQFGNLFLTIDYTNGEKNGSEIHYSDTGQVEETIYYEFGERIK